MIRDTPLLRDMFARPWAYSFVQITRILRYYFANSEQHSTFIEKHVVIRPHLALAFPSHDVVSLKCIDADGHVVPEPPDDQPPLFLLTVNMLGLYGTSSPLPTFYTEDLLAEEREDLRGMRDFLTVLNMRFYDLFLHAGWFRFTPIRTIFEQKDYSLGEKALALGGLPFACRDSYPFSIENKFPLIGLFSLFPRSAKALQSYLRCCLGCECSITECVAGFEPVPDDQRLSLGRGNCSLGEDSMLGSRLKNRAGRIKLTLENLTEEQLLHYSSPEGRKHLFKHINFYCTEPLNVDLEMSVAKDCLHGTYLYKSQPAKKIDVVQNDGTQKKSCTEQRTAPKSTPDALRGGETAGQVQACCFLGQNTWLGTQSLSLAKGIESEHTEGPGILFFRGTRWARKTKGGGLTASSP